MHAPSVLRPASSTAEPSAGSLVRKKCGLLGLSPLHPPFPFASRTHTGDTRRAADDADGALLAYKHALRANSSCLRALNECASLCAAHDSFKSHLEVSSRTRGKRGRTPAGTGVGRVRGKRRGERLWALGARRERRPLAMGGNGEARVLSAHAVRHGLSARGDVRVLCHLKKPRPRAHVG